LLCDSFDLDTSGPASFCNRNGTMGTCVCIQMYVDLLLGVLRAWDAIHAEGCDVEEREQLEQPELALELPAFPLQVLGPSPEVPDPPFLGIPDQLLEVPEPSPKVPDLSLEVLYY
jgi:hypothetical protein